MATEQGISHSFDDGYEDYEEIEVEEEVEDDEGVVGETQVAGSNSNLSRNEGVNANIASSDGKLFVGGISWETTEEIFTKHFEKYGKIRDAVIMMDRHTQMPRGFGFVTFADPFVVEAVLRDEHVIDGKTVEVKRTVPRDAPSNSSVVGSKTRKIFVGGLPASLSEDEFRDFFASYGKVLDHQIMIDHSTGRSRGFGFITFEKEETVDEIMAKGRTRELGGKQVELKRAVPKSASGDLPAGRATVNGPLDGGAYGAYGGDILGYGNVYGYGGGFGAFNRGGYGYSAGYGYNMGFVPPYGVYTYGYGTGNGYGNFYGMNQLGGRYGGRYHPYGR